MGASETEQIKALYDENEKLAGEIAELKDSVKAVKKSVMYALLAGNVIAEWGKKVEEHFNVRF
ncbi:MAG: hypothetical protein GY737_00090 [Desulfobacteraceae bacterium]|nr:hypothetical protein [Desulfobacteraceae bacterium]